MQDLCQAALNQLQDEVRALKTGVGELLAACDLEVVRGIASKSDLLTALTEEVQQLKVQCESARAQLELVDRTTHCVSFQSSSSTNDNSAWQVVTSKESKHKSLRSSQRHSTLASHPKSCPRHYVKVEGARKVWGTMRNTSASAVANIIKSLTTLSASQNDLIIKRKYKRAHNDQTCVVKWWFVIRRDGKLLEKLDHQWNLVAVQTAWQLQPLQARNDASASASSAGESLDGLASLEACQDPGNKNNADETTSTHE